jgi:hypothetical protein
VHIVSKTIQTALHTSTPNVVMLFADHLKDSRRRVEVGKSQVFLLAYWRKFGDSLATNAITHGAYRIEDHSNSTAYQHSKRRDAI